MTIEFYSEKLQTVAGPVSMLPQKGSVSGGSHRPLNSFSIRVDDDGGAGTILFDAPYSWTTEAVFALHDQAPVIAQLLSHSDVVGSADAMEEQFSRTGIPFHLHQDDFGAIDHKATGWISAIAFADFLKPYGLEVIHMPGHTPGSISFSASEASSDEA